MADAEDIAAALYGYLDEKEQEAMKLIHDYPLEELQAFLKLNEEKNYSISLNLLSLVQMVVDDSAAEDY